MVARGKENVAFLARQFIVEAGHGSRPKVAQLPWERSSAPQSCPKVDSNITPGVGKEAMALNAKPINHP